MSAGAMQEQQVADAVAAPHRVHCRVIKDFAQLSPQEVLAWQTIVARQSVFTPFASLFWNQTWWRTFGGASTAQKELLILIVLRDDEIIGFFPMLRQTYSRVGLRLLRHIKPLGADGNLTELRAGIVSPGHEADAYAMLADYFQNVDRQWDLVTLPAAPAEAGSVYDAFPEHPTLPVKEGFVLHMASDWDAFRGGLKRNIKESIRKCTNSLKREGIELDFSCLSEPGEISDLLPQFYELHSSSAAQQDGNSHRDYFEAERARRFISALAADSARSGLRLFILKNGTQLVAARLGFESERGTYLYYSGYNLDYAKYSVPTQLVIDVVKRAIGCGHNVVHMSFGRDVSKTRWGPGEMPYKCRLMFRNSPRGKLAALVVELQRRRHAMILAAHQGRADQP